MMLRDVKINETYYCTTLKRNIKVATIDNRLGLAYYYKDDELLSVEVKFLEIAEKVKEAFNLIRWIVNLFKKKP